MAAQRTEILFPPARLVQGDLYEARTQDADGKPLIVKNGPEAGKPRVEFYFAIAIPKTPGHTHWAQTDWGQKIYQAGAAAFPQMYQSQAFAWKVADGDSQIPNRRGKKPAESEGFPGHWIVRLSGGYAPKIYAQPQQGTYVELSTPNAVKCGYWVQVSGNVAGNMSTQTPGVYLNHGGVLFLKEDTVIVQGPDAATMFQGAALSQGMPSGAAPGMPPGVAMPGAMPGVTLPAMPAAMPGAPGMMMPPAQPINVAALSMPPQAPMMAPQPTMVAPNPAFLAPALPGTPTLPPQIAMPAPAVPAAPMLTPLGAATGHTYQQFISAGYNDQQLRAAGYLA